MFRQHSGQAGTGVAISSLDLSWEAWEIREALRDDIQLFVMGALGWTQRPPLFSLRDEHILSHQYKRVPGQSLFSGRSSGNGAHARLLPMMAESRLASSCETQGHVQEECSRNIRMGVPFSNALSRYGFCPGE